MDFSVPFVLASGSPRRRDLLTLTGFSFDVESADVDEAVLPNESIVTMVERLAILKAETVSKKRPNALVLGADTSVELNGRLLGKPTTPREAKDMLSRLSGNIHIVHTGIALANQNLDRSVSCVESTQVQFGLLDPDEIARYVATGSPMDKAGAYGIQDEGAFFVKAITGDFYTVMGLPIYRLYTTIRDHFSDLLV